MALSVTALSNGNVAIAGRLVLVREKNKWLRPLQSSWDWSVRPDADGFSLVISGTPHKVVAAVAEVLTRTVEGPSPGGLCERLNVFIAEPCNRLTANDLRTFRSQ